MNKGDVFFLMVWMFIPFLGIFGYYSGITWLFYTTGIITLLLASTLLLFGKLGCFTILYLVVSCVIGYFLTGTIWNGLILGSCFMLSLVYVFFILVMGFSGVSTVMGFFKKDGE